MCVCMMAIGVLLAPIENDRTSKILIIIIHYDLIPHFVFAMLKHALMREDEYDFPRTSRKRWCEQNPNFDYDLVIFKRRAFQI